MTWCCCDFASVHPCRTLRPRMQWWWLWGARPAAVCHMLALFSQVQEQHKVSMTTQHRAIGRSTVCGSHNMLLKNESGFYIVSNRCWSSQVSVAMIVIYTWGQNYYAPPPYEILCFCQKFLSLGFSLFFLDRAFINILVFFKSMNSFVSPLKNWPFHWVTAQTTDVV